MLCLPPLKQGERIIWPLGGFQIPNFSWSLGIGHTGAWWHTGRRRREWGGSTVSRSPPWTSSMIYLRGMAFASDSSIRTTRVSWCRKCGAKSAAASSSRGKWTACGCTTAAVTPSSSSRPHWTTRTPGRCWCTRCSPVSPSRLSTTRRRTACSGPTTTSSCSSRGPASPCRSAS
ncbi:SMAD family member 7 [Phyllostomus discolor]|uniref:SMAD family member 7 n=1 Tax=Phyllostomus discolor TaxID=89673 RepID=A0A833ZAN6_9CHIR|nr:SMAD family member 7 [Phyllostomus discolor]